MTEEERKNIIKTINMDIKDKENLEKEKEKLKRLENNKTVINYINTKEKIKETEDNLKKYTDINGNLKDDIDTRVTKTFMDAKFSCDHNLLLYAGSVFSNINDNDEIEFKSFKTPDNLDDCIYRFSEYICIECGSIIHVRNEKMFESTHNVLRTETIDDVLYYRNLYFQYLYAGYSSYEAQGMILSINDVNEQDYRKRLKRSKEMKKHY